MKIGIVGPGFLGTRLKSHFEKDHQILVFSRNSSLEGINDCDCLIITIAPKHKDEYEACYLQTCNKIIDQLKKDIPIIYTSSTSVYGPQNGAKVDEQTLCLPKNIYQKILLESEKSILRNKKSLIFRLGEIYGYEREIAIRVRNTKIFSSDGNNITNIIHVDDVVLCIDFALKNHLFGIYNLVSDTHITRKELYNKIAKELLLPVPQFDSTQESIHSDNKFVENKKIKQSGYIFKYPNYNTPTPIAFSPCPNDTFLFYALCNGKINSDISILPVIEDVQTLNEEAKQGRYPITKLSFYALSLLKDYTYLNVGCALGYSCGPKLISKKPISLTDIKNLRIAIPGKETTAFLLSKIFLEGPKEAVFCRYDQVFDLIDQNKVDLGIIIHEQRFTFKKAGFIEILDLGKKWEETTKLPLPLGCIAIKKSLGPKFIAYITQILEKSLKYAFSNPDESLDFVLKYAQEKDISIVKDHIKLYVNEETLKLSKKGKQAIDLLISYARQI